LFGRTLAQIDEIVPDPLLDLECLDGPAVSVPLPVPFEEPENHFGRLAQFLVGKRLGYPQKLVVGLLHSGSVVAFT
jgi:hypothetical protein